MAEQSSNCQEPGSPSELQIHNLEIDVSYFTKEGSMIRKVEDFSVKPELGESLKDSISKCVPEGSLQDPECTYLCYSLSFQKKGADYIDLHKKPEESPHIREAIRTCTKPLLVLLKEFRGADSSSRHSSSTEGDQPDPQEGGRSRMPSFVIREFMGCSDKPQSKAASPSREDNSDQRMSNNVFVEQTNYNLPYASASFSLLLDEPQHTSQTLSNRKAVGDDDLRKASMPVNMGCPRKPMHHKLRKRLARRLRSTGDINHAHKSTGTRGHGRIVPSISGPLTSVHDANGLRPTQRETNSTVHPISRPQMLAIGDLDPTHHEAASTHVPSPGPPEIETVEVVTEDGKRLTVTTNNYSTVGQLKQDILQQLSLSGESAKIEDCKVALVYTHRGRDYELLNENQFVCRTKFYDLLASGDVDVTLKVLRLGEMPAHAFAPLYRISQLTGMIFDEGVSLYGPTDHLTRVTPADMEEVQWSRRTLHDCVMEVTRSRDCDQYSLSLAMASGDISFILSAKIPLDNKILMSFYLGSVFLVKKRVSVHKRANELLAEVFPCAMNCEFVRGEDMKDHTLQLCGVETYIHGEAELLAFQDIRRCIVKDQPVHLAITRKPAAELYRAYKFPWLSLDSKSSEAPLYSDIKQSTTETSSVWDCEENLSFTIKYVDGIPLDLMTKAHCSICVTATLCHGGAVLSTTSTAEVGIKSSVGEVVEFPLMKKDLPKAAKIVFVVTENTKAPELPNFLYWGLLPVFNHRGILCNGEKTIKLWEGTAKKRTSSKDILLLKPNPSIPPSNNPHPKAVSLTVEFQTTKGPMVYPSTSELSVSTFFRNEQEMKEVKMLFDHVKKQGLYIYLLGYFANVKWFNMSECLEVYSVLEQLEDVIEHIPKEVALRLLDPDFPDERLRAFAVKVLQRVPDDELELFLLQLTQALKFESCHDSPLARLLLARALTNKRIGHSLFWYLKCELYTLQYSARFAVILEAYLKGCGEAMLTRFESQVEMQAVFEMIGRQLKEDCSNDCSKMQAALPGALEKERLSQCVLIPAYDSRLQLGKLTTSQCKVLSSAKRPFWLEMHNVHPTAVVASPTRLILKLGDDLRQDMITLRMFSLFEKLWEEQGLDLQLIPYGCMATSPRTGFIEVVKNAKTIAEVSGIRNNKKLYEWIKSHQINESGELDHRKVEAAVNKFIHSCAGYSVATYALGIGDRHNDNIMVTTSGNLFHIDFGHFLGNIKYFMGFKREWAPFVLTPDFVYVMGGETSKGFEKYKNLCCRAFRILRQHADLIINLFSMMRSTGIPELTCVEDTDYIRRAFALDKSETEAEEAFRQVIRKCLDLKWTVQFMWQVHLLRRS